MQEEIVDYEQVWENFWKEIVVDDDGNINLDQVKRELSDFKMLMSSTSEIIGEITNGLLSYPNYPARTVLNLFEENYISKQTAGEDMIKLVLNSGDLKEIINEMKEYFNISDKDFKRYTE